MREAPDGRESAVGRARRKLTRFQTDSTACDNGLFNDSLGSEQYQVMNSSMACRHPRCDSFGGRLLRTADFAWSGGVRWRADGVKLGSRDGGHDPKRQ